MTKQYMSCAQTAALVRAALKESFPGIKFGVRSSTYSGGASIRIDWIDGPNTKQVDAVAQVFCGGYFDGMIDYKGSITSMLDGELVSFGADFIFTDRRYSDAMIERAIHAVLSNNYNPEHYDPETPFTVADYRAGKGWNIYPSGGDWSRNNSLESLINIDLGKRSTMMAQPSKTAARAFPLYDDGYGLGGVSNIGNGYPRLDARG